MTIDPYSGTVPNRSTQTQSQFSTNTDNLLAYVIETFVPQLNATAVGSTSSGTFGALSVGDGSAGSGGLFFTSDTDTNIYRSALNELSIAAGGSQKLAVSSSGISVFGLIAASGRISINNGTVALPSVTGTVAGTGISYPNSGADIGFSSVGAEIFRVTDTGLRIGQTSVGLPGSGNTTVGSGINALGQGAFSADGVIGLTVNRQGSNGTSVSFRRAGTQVGSIDVTTTATTLVTSSDYRLKYEMPANDQYDPIAKVEALASAQRWYGWKTDPDAPRELGWFAHELQEIEPRAVTGVKDAVDESGEMIIQGRSDTQLIVHLVAAVAALSKRVKELESAQ